MGNADIFMDQARRNAEAVQQLNVLTSVMLSVLKPYRDGFLSMGCSEQIADIATAAYANFIFEKFKSPEVTQ